MAIETKTVNPFILQPNKSLSSQAHVTGFSFFLSLETYFLLSASSLFADTFIRLTFLQPTCTFMVIHDQDDVGECRSDKCWCECGGG